MVKARRGPVGLFQLRHGRGHVAPVPRPAVDIAKVAAGAARGDGAGGRTRTACRITQAGASSTSDAADADHRRAAAALGWAQYATTKRVPAAGLPRPGLSVSRCVEIKILRRVRAESSGRTPRHRRDACSMAWRGRFLTARPSQDGRVIAEK